MNQDFDDLEDVWLPRIPKSERPFCHARRRDNHKCKARVVPGTNRCRMHGGLSSGPKTAEGRERIAESNRRRRKKCRELSVIQFGRQTNSALIPTQYPHVETTPRDNPRIQTP